MMSHVTTSATVTCHVFTFIVTVKDDLLRYSSFSKARPHSWYLGCNSTPGHFPRHHAESRSSKIYGSNCHLGWRTLVLKCNKNNYD